MPTILFIETTSSTYDLTSTVQLTFGMENVTTTSKTTEIHKTSFSTNLSEETTTVMDPISPEMVSIFSNLLETKTDQFSKPSSIITTKGFFHRNL